MPDSHSPETAALCWLNGRILPAAEASLPVHDHGLLYGDGVFEGIRFYHRHPFRLNAHLQRLQDSARTLALTLPLSLDALARAVHEIITAYADDAGYLRLVVTRGSGPLGIDPRRCATPNVFIIADRLEMVSPTIRAQGVRVITAAIRSLPADGLDARVKSLNYLNRILARLQANQAGADEAIMLNAAGRVTEGTADNLFVVRNGKVLTPPCSEGALEGITRAEVMDLAREAGLPLLEHALTLHDLYTADECFLTGTGAELIPVREVDGRALPHCPGAVYQEIQHRFTRRVTQEAREMKDTQEKGEGH